MTEHPDILYIIDSENSSDDNICDVADIIVYDKLANKRVCLLLKKHINEFYDNIYIPMEFFKMNEWNITEVITDNVDALYFNKKYVKKNEKKKFKSVFDVYYNFIINIFSTDTNLFSLINNSKPDVYFSKIISHRPYHIISPLYIADLYITHKDNKEKIKELINILGRIILNVKNKINIFIDEFMNILNIYVYEYPIDIKMDSYGLKYKISSHQQNFMSKLILIILNLTEELIKMNIYAVHSIINRIISFYFPLDIINQYDPKEYDNQELIII